MSGFEATANLILKSQKLISFPHPPQLLYIIRRQLFSVLRIDCYRLLSVLRHC